MLHGDDVHKKQHPLPPLVLQVTLIATASLTMLSTTITNSNNILIIITISLIVYNIVSLSNISIINMFTISILFTVSQTVFSISMMFDVVVII